jgi:hypothetical protein
MFDTFQKGGTNIAWNQVWLSSSLLRLCSQDISPKTPAALLFYCALKHFNLNLAHYISVEDFTKIISIVETDLLKQYLFNDVSCEIAN